MGEIICQNCLFAEMRDGYVDPIYCRVYKRMCKLTNTCEWFNNVCNRESAAKYEVPEEYERRCLEWSQQMQKAYDDTMKVPWEVLFAPLPEWWFDFTKKTRKRLSGFVYKRGSKTPAGKWTIQMYEPIDSGDN
jgi:hypothetical protein